jgi:hypothetical protein
MHLWTYSAFICLTRPVAGSLQSEQDQIWYFQMNRCWGSPVSQLLLQEHPTFCPSTCHGSGQECSCQNGFLLGLPCVQDASFPRPRALLSTGGVGAQQDTRAALPHYPFFPSDTHRVAECSG